MVASRGFDKLNRRLARSSGLSVRATPARLISVENFAQTGRSGLSGLGFSATMDPAVSAAGDTDGER